MRTTVGFERGGNVSAGLSIIRVIFLSSPRFVLSFIPKLMPPHIKDISLTSKPVLYPSSRLHTHNQYTFNLRSLPHLLSIILQSLARGRL